MIKSIFATYLNFYHYKKNVLKKKEIILRREGVLGQLWKALKTARISRISSFLIPTPDLSHSINGWYHSVSPRKRRQGIRFRGAFRLCNAPLLLQKHRSIPRILPSNGKRAILWSKDPSSPSTPILSSNSIPSLPLPPPLPLFLSFSLEFRGTERWTMERSLTQI